MKTTVYRIQCKKGRGPFKPGFSHRWIDESVPDDARPSIMDEFGWGVWDKAPHGHAVGCAFRSLEQLRRWFTGIEIQRLYSFGYAITRMEADSVVAESEKQLVISRIKPLHSGVKRLTLIERTEPFPPQ